MKQISIDNQKYLTPSWEDLDNLCFNIAKKMIQNNESFNRLITLIKGGLAFSRSLCDYLSIQKLGTFQIRYYNGIGETNKKPEIIQMLPTDIKGESILLFDDVIDSGATLKTAVKYLADKNPQKITVASLFLKNSSPIKPDYFGEKTDAWIIFPNEVRETIELLSKKWAENSVSKEEIASRLLSLNLPREQIEYFHSS